MVMSLYELKKAVFRKMKEVFPGYTLFNESIEQGLVPPAWHIDVVPYDAPIFTKNSHDIHVFINMTHFSTRGKRDEDLIAYDKWREAFYKPLQLDTGEWVTPQEHRLLIIDGLYHMIFNVEERFFIPEDESEYSPMGELSTNLSTK